MPTTTISTNGAILISALVLLIYAGVHVVAYSMKIDTMFNILIGNDAALATTVVTYWVGSSAGSKKKDETIATMSKTGPLPTPADVDVSTTTP